MRAVHVRLLFALCAACGARAQIDLELTPTSGGSSNAGGGSPSASGGKTSGGVSGAANGGSAVTETPPASWSRVAWDMIRDGQVVQLWTGSASDTWAVRFANGGASGANFFREHWDGKSWTVTSADNGVMHFGDQQVWGAPSGNAFGGGPRVNRFSAGTWRALQTAPACSVVSGTAEDDIWCAYEAPSGSELWHFDGNGWANSPGSWKISGIQAVARDDVWLWGSALWHFDGKSWQIELDAPTRTVSANGREDVWAIPNSSTSLLRRGSRGAKWRTLDNPSGAQLSDIWSQAPNNTWIVGAGSVMRWDGVRWSAVQVPTQDEFLLISGSDRDVWIAGVLTLIHGRAAGP